MNAPLSFESRTLQQAQIRTPPKLFNVRMRHLELRHLSNYRRALTCNVEALGPTYCTNYQDPCGLEPSLREASLKFRGLDEQQLHVGEVSCGYAFRCVLHLEAL